MRVTGLVWSFQRHRKMWEGRREKRERKHRLISQNCLPFNNGKVLNYSKGQYALYFVLRLESQGLLLTVGVRSEFSMRHHLSTHPSLQHWASFLLLIFLGLKLLCLLATCVSYSKSLRALEKMPTFWAPLSRTIVWVKRHKQGCSRECSLPMFADDEIFGSSNGCGWCDIRKPFRTKALTSPAARNVGSWRLRAPGIAFDWRNLHLVPGCSPYPVSSQCRECQWPASLHAEQFWRAIPTPKYTALGVPVCLCWSLISPSA